MPTLQNWLSQTREIANCRMAELIGKALKKEGELLKLSATFSDSALQPSAFFCSAFLFLGFRFA